MPLTAFAHPLGNASIDQRLELKVAEQMATLRYVVAMAEIPSIQALTELDPDSDGRVTDTERADYLTRIAPRYVGGLELRIDGEPARFEIRARALELTEERRILPLLQIELELTAALPEDDATHLLELANRNHEGRTCWCEIVVAATPGTSVFDSSAFGDGLSAEYEAASKGELRIAPPDERMARLSFRRGSVPANARPLAARNGQPLLSP